MADIIEEIDKRKSHRALSGEEIPEASVSRILKAATYAPSCFNNQPWRFLVLKNNDALAKVKKALSKGNYWAQISPLIIAVLTKPDLDCRSSDRRDYALFDTGLAAENLILQAVREGLVAHPIAGFDPAVVKEEFGIPDEYIIVTLIVIGCHGELARLSDDHKKTETSERSRFPEHQIISYDGWGNNNGDS